MVTFLPILAILSGLLLFGTIPAQSAGQSCLKCHATHYAERGLCTDCHRGNPGSDRKNIAHHQLIAGRFSYFTLGNVAVVKEGNRLADQLACRRCHQVGGKGNRLAASLDTIMAVKQPDETVDSIRRPVQGMPDFGLDDQQAAALVNAIYYGSRKDSAKGGERPLVRHFDKNSRSGEDLFGRNCGACHRMLTARKGLVGSGDIGPNLSGLLSQYYPSTYRAKEKWNFAALQKWVKNPRFVLPNSTMRPIKLDEKQWRELKRTLE